MTDGLIDGEKIYQVTKIIYRTHVKRQCMVCGVWKPPSSVVIKLKRNGHHVEWVCMNEKCCKSLGLSGTRAYALATMDAPQADDRKTIETLKP